MPQHLEWAESQRCVIWMTPKCHEELQKLLGKKIRGDLKMHEQLADIKMRSKRIAENWNAPGLPRDLFKSLGSRRLNDGTEMTVLMMEQKVTDPIQFRIYGGLMRNLVADYSDERELIVFSKSGFKKTQEDDINLAAKRLGRWRHEED